MIARTRHGRQNEKERMNTESAPALKSVSTSRGCKIQPPALIGLVIPANRALLTHLLTNGKSGAPESPPPPYFLSGDSSEPKSSRQLISLGNAPQGIVFDTQSASQTECLLIFNAASTDKRILNFSIMGISRTEATVKTSMASSTNFSGCKPTFGQDILICKPNSARSE